MHMRTGTVMLPKHADLGAAASAPLAAASSANTTAAAATKRRRALARRVEAAMNAGGSRDSPSKSRQLNTLKRRQFSKNDFVGVRASGRLRPLWSHAHHAAPLWSADETGHDLSRPSDAECDAGASLAGPRCGSR